MRLGNVMFEGPFQIHVNYVGLIWSLFLFKRSYLSEMWQGLQLRTDTKKRWVTMRMCSNENENELCALIVDIYNWESIHDHLKNKKISNQTSYFFCTSTPLLKLEMTVFVIHNQ